jgi:hypothetical protein
VYSVNNDVSVCVVDRPIVQARHRETDLIVLPPPFQESPREPAAALALLAVTIAVTQRHRCPGLEHNADRRGGGGLLLLAAVVAALVSRGIGEPQQARVSQRGQLAQAPKRACEYKM